LAVYALIEFILAVFDFIRGIMERRNFFQELKFIPARISICIILRELIRFHVKMDILRGVKIINANLLGYDEQSHRRGPTSAFAHWTLKGIDNLIKDIYKTACRSDCRDYRIIIYSDHGQETVDNFAAKYRIPVTQAIERVFSEINSAETRLKKQRDDRSLTYLYRRARHMLLKKSPVDSASALPKLKEIEVTAMGPLGHVYLPSELLLDEKQKISQKLVKHAGIPMVLFKAQGSVTAVNDEGVFDLKADSEKILGKHHPFLPELTKDLTNLCRHPDAGDLVISGWKRGQRPISFARERGAHGGPGTEETRGFVVLPAASERSSTYLRGLDLRKYVLGIFEAETSFPNIRQRKWRNDGRFRVLSYNVHSCVNMDGKLFPGRVARVVADLAPDIVALQEVDLNMPRSHGMDQARFLAERLDMDYRFFPVVENYAGKYGLALLSRFPIFDVKYNLLPALSNTGKGERRGVMWAKIKSPAGVINLLNTHLSFSRKERSLQMGALLERTKSAIEQKEPIILCGDLNAGPHSPAYRRLSTYFHDVQYVNKSQISPKATFFSRYPLLRIDHIFVSEHFQSLSVRIPDNYDAKMASDHLPVLTELYLETGGKK
jgi:endonuclease/exonuclease/phosphatase family metal-dependent hydrolase